VEKKFKHNQYVKITFDNGSIRYGYVGARRDLRPFTLFAHIEITGELWQSKNYPMAVRGSPYDQ